MTEREVQVSGRPGGWRRIMCCGWDYLQGRDKLRVLRQDEVRAVSWESVQVFRMVDTSPCRGERRVGRRHVPIPPSIMRVKSGNQQVGGCAMTGVDGLAFQRRAIQQGTGGCTQLPREKVAQRQYAWRRVTSLPARSPAPAQVIWSSTGQVRPIYFREK